MHAQIARAMVLPALPGATPDNDFAQVYEAHYDLLVGIAVRKFGISPSDAETLAHEVFLDYLVGADRVIDHHAWLIGAICNASRAHLRLQQRTTPLDEHHEPPDPRSTRVVDEWTDQLAARQAFACLTPRCQLVLRLRYLEGYTAPEIAEIVGTSKKYAQKLIGRCLQQAFERYRYRRDG